MEQAWPRLLHDARDQVTGWQHLVSPPSHPARKSCLLQHPTSCSTTFLPPASPAGHPQHPSPAAVASLHPNQAMGLRSCQAFLLTWSLTHQLWLAGSRGGWQICSSTDSAVRAGPSYGTLAPRDFTPEMLMEECAGLCGGIRAPASGVDKADLFPAACHLPAALPHSAKERA